MGKLLTFDMVNRPKPGRVGGRSVWGMNGGGHTHTHTRMSERKETHTHFLRVVSVQINNILSFCESCLPSCWFVFQRRRDNPPPPAPPPTHPPHRHHHHSFSPPPPASFTLQTPESYLALLRRKEGHVLVGNKRLSVEEENQAHGHCVTRSSRDMLDRCPFLSAH